MTAIPGVQVKKDANGELTHVQIDVRQHKEAIPVLKELGLLEEEMENEERHTIEESKSYVYEVIKQFYESNHQ